MNVTLSQPRQRVVLWSIWVVAALFMLPLLGGAMFAVVVAGSALLLAAIPGALPRVETSRNRRELFVIGMMYLAVVGLLRLAFDVFTVANVAGLFLAFAAALVVGTAGPIIYIVWFRGGSLRDLGLRADNWRPTAALALLFGGVQFALTLWGFSLPASPENWVPLLVMALVVGVFESVFFRGFIQNRLEAQFGPVVGIATAAVLYGLYHIGYGMGLTEIGFLVGLGVIYAVTFAVARNLLVLWPLLTPLGSFFANIRAGGIHLPWMSILGFADVLVVVIVVMVVARRHERRRAAVETSTAAKSSRSRRPSMINPQQQALPRPRAPGPETAALDRFYTDVTWTGTIEPNGMGPGTMDRRGLPPGPVPSGRHVRAHLATALGDRLGHRRRGLPRYPQ